MSQQNIIISRRYDSPCGPLLLSAFGNCLVGCRWSDEAAAGGNNRVLETAMLQLDEYFEGKRTCFDIPMSVDASEFRMRVWQALATVQYGRVMTYGQLARCIGNNNAAQAVGAAVAANPINILIPCHRIISAGNGIGGYAGGPEAKRFLLALERKTRQNSLFS